MPKVSEFIDRSFACLSPADPVTKAAREMSSSQRGAVPVCENGKFRGIVTEREIVTVIVAAHRDPLVETAGSIMNADVPVVSPGDDIWQAANVMVESGVWMIPVTENGKFLGMFTLMNFARESPAMAAMVFARTVKREACCDLKK